MSAGLSQRVRWALASAASKRAPALLSYLASPESRRGIDIRTRGDRIDLRRDSDRAAIRVRRSHAHYIPDIINCFNYYFGSVEHGGPPAADGYIVADFSEPADHRLAGFPDFPVGFPSLPEPIVTTQQYVDFAQLPPGGVAIDLGSYSGLTSIVFSKLVGPAGKVLALEPDPISFPVARRNVDRHVAVNGLDNIELMQAAAAGTRGTLRLSSEGALGSSIVAMVGGRRGSVVEVNAYRLEDLIELHRLDRLDFLKIDIEGSEVDVLRSSAGIFQRFRPRVIIEPHVIDRLNTTEPVLALLSSFGYVCDKIPQEGVQSLPLIAAWSAETRDPR